jgi:hypothetical protein
MVRKVLQESEMKKLFLTNYRPRDARIIVERPCTILQAQLWTTSSSGSPRSYLRSDSRHRRIPEPRLRSSSCLLRSTITTTRLSC